MKQVNQAELVSLLEAQPYLAESLYCFCFYGQKEPIVTKTFTLLDNNQFAVNTLNMTSQQIINPDSDDLYAELSAMRAVTKCVIDQAVTANELYLKIPYASECYTGTITELQSLLQTQKVMGDTVFGPTFLVIPEYSTAKRCHIQQQLLQYKTNLTEQGYQVMGLFLTGSQNYQMDTLHSKIDAVAVIIPTMDDFVYHGITEQTMHTKTGDIHIKDIRRFAAQLLNGHYLSLEWLLTPYKVVDGTYFSDLLQPSMMETLLNISPVRMVSSAFHSIMKIRLQTSGEKRDGANAAKLAYLLRFIEYVLKQLETKDTLSLDEWRYAISGNFHFGCDNRMTTDSEILQLQRLKTQEYLDKEVQTDLYCTLQEQEIAYRKQYTDRYPNHMQQAGSERQQDIAHQLARWVTKTCLLFLLEQNTKSAIVDSLLPE